MNTSIQFALLFAPALVMLLAQTPTSALPTDRLLSELGPTFQIADYQMPKRITLIAYGDQRFTDPANTQQADPRIRQWLVHRAGKERSSAVIIDRDGTPAG